MYKGIKTFSHAACDMLHITWVIWHAILEACSNDGF